MNAVEHLVLRVTTFAVERISQKYSCSYGSYGFSLETQFATLAIPSKS